MVNLCNLNKIVVFSIKQGGGGPNELFGPSYGEYLEAIIYIYEDYIDYTKGPVNIKLG